ncbi:MAG: hypothetical protein R3E13_06005 [Alphaproteobacteria bacterium]
MNIATWNVLLVVALLIVLSGGGYILYQNNLQKQAEVAQVLAEEQAEAARAKEEEQVLLQEFEDFLNQFLSDVYEKAQAYKQNRGVLNELGKPLNLTEPEYIRENARLAESTVMSLQLQMDDIMNIFEQADADIQDLIGQLEGEARENVRQSWVEVRDENIEKYGAFFATEQDVLMAQLKLIEFYAEHSEVLSVDADNGRVLFEDGALQEREALLRGEIMRLRAEQKDVLQNG